MQDTLRYTLTSNAPENKDNDFTWKDFQAKNNNELVAIFGNFINRVVILTHKYFEGKNPELDLSNEVDKKILNEIYSFPKKIGDLIEKYKFREAVNTLIDLARLGNKYLADEEPWKLIKTDQKDRDKTIMNISLQLCGVLSVVSEPFLPSTSSKLKNILNINENNWDSISINNPLVINNINKSQLIFRKIEDHEIDFQLQKLNESNKIAILGCGWLGLPLAKSL